MKLFICCLCKYKHILRRKYTFECHQCMNWLYWCIILYYNIYQSLFQLTQLSFLSAVRLRSAGGLLNKSLSVFERNWSRWVSIPRPLDVRQEWITSSPLNLGGKQERYQLLIHKNDPESIKIPLVFSLLMWTSPSLQDGCFFLTLKI